jgi:hypothetical protein
MHDIVRTASVYPLLQYIGRRHLAGFDMGRIALLHTLQALLVLYLKERHASQRAFEIPLSGGLALAFTPVV